MHRKTCGSEPAREEASKPNIHVTEPPLSRAGSLPQWACGEHKTYEYPKSLWEPSLLAMRSAHPTSPKLNLRLRGGPTEQCLRSGTPSLGEVPSGGTEALRLLSPGPAFRLFESDPPSGRNPKFSCYRRNGYTPQPNEQIPRLCDTYLAVAIGSDCTGSCSNVKPRSRNARPMNRDPMSFKCASSRYSNCPSMSGLHNPAGQIT